MQNRDTLIHPDWEKRLYMYITGIIQNKEQKMLAINGVSNHLHFLIGMKPSCCLSDLIREVKKSSNEFIKLNKFTKFKFNWQSGFGSFSYSPSHVDNVIKYIMNQKEHHKKQSFRDEYLLFLKQFDIKQDEKYLFNWI